MINLKAIIAALVNREQTIGTAFYIGNNYFISVYHCISDLKSITNLNIVFAEQNRNIPVSRIYSSAENDILILYAHDIFIDLIPFSFVKVEDLNQVTKFWTSGFGDRDNYPQYVPTADNGEIVDVLNYGRELDIQGDNLFVGMSGAPLIVNYESCPLIAGMIRKVSKGGTYIKGANKAIAISSNEILKVLDNEEIHYMIDSKTLNSRRNIASQINSLLRNDNAKIYISGPKGVGKKYLLNQIARCHKKGYVWIESANDTLTLNEFLLNSQLRDLLSLYREYLNIESVIADVKVGNCNTIIVCGYNNIDIQVIELLERIRINAIVSLDIQEAHFEHWNYIEVKPLNFNETSDLIRTNWGYCGLPEKENEFVELADSIFLISGGIPLLIQWVCVHVFMFKKTLESVIMDLRSNINNEIEYYKYIDNIVRQLSDCERDILGAISASASGMSKNMLKKLFVYDEHNIIKSIDSLLKYCLIYSNGEIKEEQICYRAHTVVTNYFSQQESYTDYVKKYIDVLSDYADANDFDLIIAEDIWKLFRWYAKYDSHLFVNYMYAFSYYFFETGNIYLRKQIGYISLKLCEQNDWEKDYYWTQINEIAYLEYIQGNYNIAEKILIECYNRVREMYEIDTMPTDRFSNTFIYGLLNRYLALVYIQREEYIQAIKKFREALKVFRQIERNSIIHNVYIEIAELYIKAGKYSKAKILLLKCKNHYSGAMKPWMRSWLARTYMNLSVVFEKMEDEKESVRYLDEAESLASLRTSRLIMIDICTIKARRLLSGQRYIDGYKYIKKARDIAKQMKLYNKLIHIYDIERTEYVNDLDNDSLVMIMSKAPYSKQSKTRLAKDIGDLSNKVAECMLFDLVNELICHSDFDLCVCIPNTDIKYLQDINNLLGEVEIKVRNSDTLRGKESDLYLMFLNQLNQYEKVVMVYSDTPFLTKNIVEDALHLLDQVDVVIGTDGAKGYYLVGMRTAVDIFTPLENKTIPYLDQSIEIIEANNLSYSFVSPLRDIDCLSDILQIDWHTAKSWETTRQLLTDNSLIH